MKNNKNLIIGINLGDFGSTANIMYNSLEYAAINGSFDTIACISHISGKYRGTVESILFDVKIGRFKNIFYKFFYKYKLYLSNDGNHFNEHTRKLIKIIKEKSKKYDKTIIHIHNLHMCNINVDIFYKWLGKHDEYSVLYTLHDCWTFTGGCYCYDFIGCKEWQEECRRCPQNIRYSTRQLKKRTRLLKQIKNLTLIPCSEWLSFELKKSYLKNIPTIVNNGETSIKPFKGRSNLKSELGMEDNIILISVAAYWSDWKGVKYLYQLSDILPKKYKLLIIGSNFEKRSSNIVCVESINDSDKLAEYYSVADVFVSTTQSDNLPLVLMEAQICGIPVVGFGHGGTPEEITDKSGIMVGTDNDINKLLKAITYVVEEKPFKKEDIIASGNRFSKYESAKRQLIIYNEAIKND